MNTKKKLKEVSKLVSEKNETKKTLEFIGSLRGFRKPRPPAPPKPMNFTQMPATCVCGRSLTLTLQEPYLSQISWHAFCVNCRWHVSVVLKK